jgi:hypothetical protein
MICLVNLIRHTGIQVGLKKCSIMIVKQFKEFEETLLKELNISYRGLNLCELGAQQQGETSAKKIYEEAGVNHTSIDLNGIWGSLMIDLGMPVPVSLEGKFDLITNYGTAEHVNNQYGVYSNVHKMCKENGIMIHGAPLVGNWPRHCRYYYTESFFKELSIMNGYDIIKIYTLKDEYFKFPNELVITALRKKNKEFISESEFNSIKLLDTKDTSRTQNYTKR